MHGHVFTKQLCAPMVTRVVCYRIQILRRIPDHAAGVELIVRSHHHPPGQVNLGANHAIWPHLHPFIDDGIRTHAGRRVRLCLQVDVWRWDGS